MILVGHVVDKLRELPDGSVQVCCTSPPFYGLRNYGTKPQAWGGDPFCLHDWVTTCPPGARTSDTNPGPCQSEGTKNRERLKSSTCGFCGAYSGELGLEPTPEMYIQHVVEVFREVRRVLRPDGLLWVEIGDSYAATGKSGGGAQGRRWKIAGADTEGPRGGKWSPPPPGYKPKDLLGIPWMLAFALRADGWYLRQDIVWHRPNPMPESVKDRCTKSHTYVFMLSKSARYYYNADAVKEPLKDPGAAREAALMAPAARTGSRYEQAPDGRNRRSVWTVTTQPWRGAHFATWPERLVEPMILSSTRTGDLVLDPFAGSGTTWVVAARLGRRFVGCELNPEYVKMAHERVIAACRKILGGLLCTSA